MTRKTKKSRFRRGFTLVEIPYAILILLIAIIGTSKYRYYTSLDVKKADMQTTATRIGLLFCENWRGVKGSQTYDPTVCLGSEFASTPISCPSSFNDFNLLEGRTVVSNGTDYYVFLLYKDIGSSLRALNILVAWSPQRYKITTITDITDTDRFRLFELTTYATN